MKALILVILLAVAHGFYPLRLPGMKVAVKTEALNLLKDTFMPALLSQLTNIQLKKFKLRLGSIKKAMISARMPSSEDLQIRTSPSR